MVDVRTKVVELSACEWPHRGFNFNVAVPSGVGCITKRRSQLSTTKFHALAILLASSYRGRVGLFALRT